MIQFWWTSDAKNSAPTYNFEANSDHLVNATAVWEQWSYVPKGGEQYRRWSENVFQMPFGDEVVITSPRSGGPTHNDLWNFFFISSMIAPKQFQKFYLSPNDLTFSWNHFVCFGWPTEYWPTDKPTGNLGHKKSKSESCWSYLVGEQSCLLSSPSKVLVLAANINMDFSGASFLSISRQGVGCWCCRQPMCMCFQNINLVFRF